MTRQPQPPYELAVCEHISRGEKTMAVLEGLLRLDKMTFDEHSPVDTIFICCPTCARDLPEAYTVVTHKDEDAWEE